MKTPGTRRGFFVYEYINNFLPFLREVPAERGKGFEPTPIVKLVPRLKPLTACGGTPLKKGRKFYFNYFGL